MLSLSLTGTAPWTIRYTIDGVEKSFVANSQEATIPISQGGVYRMLAVDDSYCSGSVSESEQVIYEKPTAVLSGEAQSICGENGIAKLQITFTGSGPYNLTYSNGSQEQSLTTEQMNYELEVAEAGTYSLVSLTNDNCTGTVSGSVMIDNKADEMTAEILGPDNSCFGESIDLQLTYAPAEASVQLTTTGAGVLTEKQDNNFTYEPAEDESGAILFEAELTTECGTARFEKQVNISPELDADFTVEPDKIVTNSQATFKPVLESADAYSWEFGDGTRSDAQLTNNRYEESGIYTVTLSIEKDGCKSSGSKEIEVYLENVLYVPNAFSPLASNPESQVVKVYGENVSNDGFNFKIVNRWGKVMYETSSFDEANLEGWKGIHNGISEEMELNVFTYVLTGKFIEGESFEKTGTVTLIK
jgi:PKD repeat protein